MFENVALVDADSIYFRIACVQKKKKDIRKGINYTMNEILKETGAMKTLVAVKGRGNFRHDIYSKYKANRKELDGELKEALRYGHQYMVDYHGAVMANGMEADDLVAIWAAECRNDNLDYTVVGIDKDLLQIPGHHYNFVKHTHSDVSPAEGRYNLMVQCLTGDTSDNIPGVKGIGPVKAKKILSGIPVSRQWTRVRAAWRAHGAGRPELSRALLTMLTSFEEEQVVRDLFKSKTAKRKPDVLSGEASEDKDILGLPT